MRASFSDFDRRARSGDRLTVVFFGGSLTWGARASDPAKTSYRAIVGRRLSERYPEARFTFVDAAIGGTGAQLGAFRLERDVLAKDPNLVFLDFTLNDDIYLTSEDTLAAYEAIVRRCILAGIPVIQMILAAKEFITNPAVSKMRRLSAHLDIAAAYHTAVGDAVRLMRERHKRGLIDLDAIWPPDSFDMTHPDDPGYALYAEAAMSAYDAAVSRSLVCRIPERMTHRDTYMTVSRVRLSSLPSLPFGWRVAKTKRESVAFDFYMSRWLDDVAVASNFIETGRNDFAMSEPAEPLVLNVQGSSVLLFGEATARSCGYEVTIDEGPTAHYEANLFEGTGRLWSMLAENLDVSRVHRMVIEPIFASDKPQELRIESICVAGGKGAGLSSYS